jgi:hypothetical protein
LEEWLPLISALNIGGVIANKRDPNAVIDELCGHPITIICPLCKQSVHSAFLIIGREETQHIMGGFPSHNLIFFLLVLPGQVLPFGKLWAISKRTAAKSVYKSLFSDFFIANL